MLPESSHSAINSDTTLADTVEILWTRFALETSCVFINSGFISIIAVVNAWYIVDGLRQFGQFTVTVVDIMFGMVEKDYTNLEIKVFTMTYLFDIHTHT